VVLHLREARAAAPPSASHSPYGHTSNSGSRSPRRTDTQSTHTSRGTFGPPPCRGAAYDTSPRTSSTHSRSGRRSRTSWARGLFWGAWEDVYIHSLFLCMTCRTCAFYDSSFEFKFFFVLSCETLRGPLAHRNLLLLAPRHGYSALRLLKIVCLSSPLSGPARPRRRLSVSPGLVPGPTRASTQRFQPEGLCSPGGRASRLHLGTRVWPSRGLAACPKKVSEVVQGRSSAASEVASEIHFRDGFCMFLPRAQNAVHHARTAPKTGSGRLFKAPRDA